MIRLLLTITFTVTFLCNSAYSQYNFDVNLIPDSLSDKTNSVIRHSHVHLEMFEDKLTYKYNYAITALNKKHEDKLLFVAHYQKGQSKVKDLKITIYDAEGSLVKKIKKKEIKEYGLQDIEFADDTRSMIYEYKSPVFPVTMHVTFEQEFKSPYFVRNWYPISDFKQSIELATFRIVDHVGDSFNYQAYDLPEPVEQSLMGLYYTYENRKGYAKERYMPDLKDCLPRLELALKRLKYFDHVGKINNWSEFGIWIYKEMFLPKQDLDISFLKNETAHLIEPGDSEIATAQKLYKYIQETTRYILISLDDGGWSPLSISTVHDRKYGDCKALSFYYNTLCNAYGIDASLVLVHAGERKRSAKPDFYSTTQFNHVISKLNIEDQTYWVDCTSKVAPFNFLGGFTADRNALLIEENQGTIVRTPDYKNGRSTLTSMTFTNDGNLDGSIEINTEGIGITSKLYKLPNQTEQEKLSYQRDLLAKYRNLTIHDYSYQFDTSHLVLKEVLNVSCNSAGEKLGDHFKIKINRSEIELPALKKDKNRVWPIVFLRNKVFESITKLKHDLSFVPVKEKDIQLETEFGSYSFSTETKAGEILIKRTLIINKGNYKNDRYKEIKSFFDKIKKVEKRAILLSSKS